MSRLDLPLDPEGDSYTQLMCAEVGRFRYAVACRHRIFFTNSKRRWKRHYQAAKRRGLPGTWFVNDGERFNWSRIRLSDAAL